MTHPKHAMRLRRTSRSLGLLLATAVALPAAAAPASVAPTKAVPGENRDAAKVLLAAGNGLYEKGQFAPALAKFREAFAAFRSPKIIFNIAQCELKLGRKREAANDYAAFLGQTLETSALAQMRATAREQLAGLTEGLAKLQLEPQPADAQLLLDGEPPPNLETFVAPGSHTLTATAPGFEPLTRPVDVKAAEAMRVPLVLRPLQPPTSMANTEPVLIPAPAPTPAATPTPQPAVAQLGQPGPAPSHHGSRWIPGWALMAGGGASLIGSGILGALAVSSNNSLSDVVDGNLTPGATRPDVPALRSNVQVQSIGSTVLTGVGAAAVGVGIWLLLSDAPEAADASAPTAPAPESR